MCKLLKTNLLAYVITVFCRYCGHTYQFIPVYSTSNFVLIRFHSDSSWQGKGFALKFTKLDRPSKF